MEGIDFTQLTQYAKAFTAFTPDKEKCLQDAANTVGQEVQQVTENFYAVLTSIDKTKPYLEGRVELLKQSHLHWLKSLFTGPYDEDYTKAMYHVGDVHVKVNLPVEFMAGSMSLISGEFNQVVTRIYANDPEKMFALLNAINAVLGFSLMVMQESYQASTLASELDKFLKISGISRTLFNNMAKAYSL